MKTVNDMEDQVRDKVYIQVEDRVNHALLNKVGLEVWYYVWNRIYNRVNDQARKLVQEKTYER